ncbi:VanZ family protein, partial [Duganella callida]
MTLRPQRCAALPCALLLAAAIAGYPLGAGWLSTGLLAWLLLLRRWPQAWLPGVLALLPVLDGAQWSGRLYLDEFDCLLAATVLAQALGPARPAARLGRWPALALGLVALTTASSLIIGCWPLPVPGPNSFNNYYSAYNGLRLAKGLLWALMLWPALAEELQHDADAARRRFALGMSLGLVTATLAVLWERATFPGLLNFSSGYRVVGLFTGMHVGGACIEAWFAMSLPFAAWWALTMRGWRRLAGVLMCLLGCYALVVCYARGGYLAAAVGLAVVAAGLGLKPRRGAMAARNPGP